MNYLILKTVIESTIQNYNQQNGHAQITEQNVTIVKMSQKGIDLTIHDPHNGQDVQVHAEVNFMNGPLPANFSVTGVRQEKSKVKGQVSDQDVTEIRQALKNNSNVSDLFGAE
jgi:hypothetical protein